MTTTTEQGTPISGVPCSVSDCTKTAHSRSYCQQHYRRWHKYGDPEYPLQPRGRKRSPDSTDHRKLDPDEKARRAAERKLARQSRTHCTNGHELPPRAEKPAPAPRAAREDKTHCVNSHELTPSNTYTTKKGQKTCRICTRSSQQRYHGRAVTEDAPIGPRNKDKTHCPFGHEYTPQNTSWFQGQRRCRACKLDISRKKLYGLSREAFATVLVEQRNACAICLTELTESRNIHVDHCHTSGAVRGLLCSGCNLMLGHAQDQADRLRAGADYLARFREDSAAAAAAS